MNQNSKPNFSLYNVYGMEVSLHVNTIVLQMAKIHESFGQSNCELVKVMNHVDLAYISAN